MSDIDRYLSDDLIARVADVLDTRRHNYDVNSATWKPYCICGWSAEEPYDVAAYDRHLAVEALKAAAPLIAAQALRDAADRLDLAAFAVDAKHHIHETTCLCGFEGNARKRTQTEHITAAVIEEYNHE